MKRLVCLAALLLLAGCQITTKDGSKIGFRVNMGEIGIELYSEAKETSGEGLIRADVDKGVQEWIFNFDSDGDGEDDMSVEPEPIE